jgi:hypothetical protein
VVRGTTLICAALLALGAPAAAGADTFCAPVADGPTCLATAALALDAADDHAGADVVRLGAVDEELTFADASDNPVEIIGAGPSVTKLRGPVGIAPVLALEHAASSVSGVTVTAGENGTAVRVAGAIRRSVVVGGTGIDIAGAARVEAVAVRLTGGLGNGVATHCFDTVLRHVTVVGDGAAGVASTCATPVDVDVEVSSSLVDVEPAFDPDPDVDVTTVYSWFTPVAEVERSGSDIVAPTPGLAADGVRLAVGSVLVDAGDPALLDAATETLEARRAGTSARSSCTRRHRGR